MLPQHFTAAGFFPNQQYANGYSGPSSQSVEPGPSSSTSHPFPPLSSSNDIDNPLSPRSQRTLLKPKRKRGNSVTEDNPDNSPNAASGSANGSQKNLPKKKKANRACLHCQKAHLTCDDSRPCQRCIKRGLADKCTEGLRKKAKYLLDEDELAALKIQQHQRKAREKSTSIADTPNPPQSSLSRQEQDLPINAPEPEPLFNLSLDPSYPFGSEAANLEYSMLTAILGNPSPPGPSDENSRLNHPSVEAPLQPTVNGSYPQFANPGWPAPPPPLPSQPNPHPLVPPQVRSPIITPSFLLQPSSTDARPTFTSTNSYRPPLEQAQTINQGSFQSPTSSHPTRSLPTIHQPQAQLHYSQPAWSDVNTGQQTPSELTKPQPMDQTYMRAQQSSSVLPYSVDAQSRGSQSQVQALAPLSPPPSNSSPGTPGETIFPYQANQMPRSEHDSTRQRSVIRTRPAYLHQTPQWGTSNNSECKPHHASKNYHTYTLGDESVSSVYETVTKPYDYTQGYHVLMRFLHERFDKNDILRVVRALAIVRPSLIALQMPLTEEDEVFVEKCFQRSLIELDKLISFGGTPTVVWRRTGEICLVGFEFTMLTDWTREELLGKTKYIFELFENQSTVEYYENFAAHAFENTTQSVISQCVLLKPSGVVVPCSFCFSIRRDIFDLPSIIIGQWLPLL